MPERGVLTTYWKEIEEYHSKGMPIAHITDVLISKYQLTTPRETLRKKLNRYIKSPLTNSVRPEMKSAREIVREYVEGKTTQSSQFHKLKTELGLHENEFNLPEPLDDSVKTIKLPTGCNNILFISDLQIPFHDIPAITCALKYGLEHNVNTIYINGDLVDFYAISSYQTEKSKRDLVGEIEMTREFLQILRSRFPNAHIYLKRGNHEIRWERYIYNNAKMFEDLQELQFASMFHLDKHDIHLIEDTTIVNIGLLTAIHAHEVRGVGGVFPARTLFMKTMTSAICGDCHRSSEYTAKTITDRFHTCWTVGCLSVLRPNYSPGAQYNHGFAHIQVRDNGEFHVKNFRVLDGKII